MRILNVSGENFGRYKKFSLDVGSRGFVGIMGTNLDDPTATSNGSGKSTIVEAIGWGLYGHTHRHGYVTEGVVAPWSKWCEVRVALEGVWKNPVIVRRVDNGTHTLSIEIEGEETKGQDLKDTQARINSMLGQTWNVFAAVSSFGQRKLHQWPLLEPSRVRAIFNEALNLGLYDTFHKIAKDKHKEAIKELNAEEIRLDEAKRTIESLKEDIEDKKTSLAKWKKLNKGGKGRSDKKHKALLASLNKKIEKAKRELEDKETASLSLQKEIAREETSQKSLLAGIREARATLQDKRDLLAETRNKGVCPTCGQSIKGKASKKAQGKYLAEVNEARETYDLLQENLVEVEDKLRTLRGDDQSEMDSVAPFREAYQDLKQKKRDLIAEKTHQDNNKEMGKDLEASLENAEVKLDHKIREVAGLSQSVDRWAYRAAGLKYLMDYYGPSGARLIKLSRYTPVLNHYASKYASFFLGGGAEIQFSTVKKLKSGELREKFSVTAKIDGGADNYLSMSGGERQRADLACNLAFRAMMMELAERQASLLVCDEVFDGLDAAGRDALNSFIQDEIGESGTCFVISHEADLVRYYPSIERVRKKGGVCRQAR